jgi:hypothetical protein
MALALSDYVDEFVERYARRLSEAEVDFRGLSPEEETRIRAIAATVWSMSSLIPEG